MRTYRHGRIGTGSEDGRADNYYYEWITQETTGCLYSLIIILSTLSHPYPFFAIPTISL